MFFDIAQVSESGVVSYEPLSIYTGMLGQIGDIVIFTATARRLKQLFPHSSITFAVSARYREAGELVAGLPYIDRLFVTRLYFEKLTSSLLPAWERGWPVQLCGEDELAEQSRHDLVLETRSRPRRMPWWQYGHLVSERAHMVAVPGPIDLRTEIRIPQGVSVPPAAQGKIVLHNDPAISADKAWSWSHLRRLVRQLGPDRVVLLGSPGPEVPGSLDLRGQTSLAQAAAIIAGAHCYVGVDSGLLWIAGSLQVPVVGIFGTEYVPAYSAGYPSNPRAVYLQAEGPVALIPPEQVFHQILKTMENTAEWRIHPS